MHFEYLSHTEQNVSSNTVPVLFGAKQADGRLALTTFELMITENNTNRAPHL